MEILEGSTCSKALINKVTNLVTGAACKANRIGLDTLDFCGEI